MHKARGENCVDKMLSEAIVEEPILEPEERSAQDVVGMGNNDPVESTDVEASDTEEWLEAATSKAMCGEDIGATGDDSQDDRKTGWRKIERTPTVEGGAKRSEGKHGSVLGVLEEIEEDRDANAEQGAAETAQDVDMPELCVFLDTSSKLEDIESSDGTDGEARGAPLWSLVKKRELSH